MLFYFDVDHPTVICVLDYCNALFLRLPAKSSPKVVVVEMHSSYCHSSFCKTFLTPVLHRLLSICFFGTIK